MAWTEAVARTAAVDALARLGDDAPRLDLLRFGENALYAYPAGGLVVRVARPGTRPERVRRTLAFTSKIASLGVDVTEPADIPSLPQPVVTPAGVVSLWIYHDADPGCRVTPRELGGLLRRFHETAVSAADLVDPWDPFELIRPRLAAARRDGVPPDLLTPLDDSLAALTQTVPTLTSALGRGVIHGDMHYGNVLCLPRRRHVLIDFDQIAHGPLEWDLVPSLVTHRRFGMPDRDYEDFSAAYGYDLRTSPHAADFVALRELGMTTWLLQQHGASAAVDDEIRLRIASLGEPCEPGAHATAWTPR